MKKTLLPLLAAAVMGLAGCASLSDGAKTPVDYVNPYMGNISHLLVPTYPTVHLPNSMLRVYPERADFTGDRLRGLPLIVTSHRGRSAFNLSPVQGGEAALQPVVPFSYDNERLKPYYYAVRLDEQQTDVRYAPSRQSAVYEIDFRRGEPVFLVLNSASGAMQADGNTVSGWQQLDNGTRVYLFLETQQRPVATLARRGGAFEPGGNRAEGRDAAVALAFGNGPQTLNIRYGVSFISAEQAEKNLRREIGGYDPVPVARAGRKIWNDALGKIKVSGGEPDDKTVFYTSLYRCYERPVCISEDGRYYSAFDGQVHDDAGTPFYTDDWIWDTYRAVHPLRVLTEPALETAVIRSYIRMAEQMDSLWMPTFPEITGDSRRMNSNHAVATVADAWAKGLRDFDAPKAYLACKKAITEKTLAPWSGKPAGWLDDFYKRHGYIPALAPGEPETVPEVHGFEKRQPVAVTLGTAYDEWCLSQLAGALGYEADRGYFGARSKNYRNLYNPDTKFFHPKDKDGRFIEPFDYRFPGGPGAREYYGENNGWVYRWDVPHDIPGLIALMGGPEAFDRALDETFREPLGRGKSEFYAQLPDHTGNVGQFSMANEPSLHIPYLYNYAGKPWKTQKRVRTLLGQWFRNDLMGVPGDEDGGGMSAFVAFSMLGFYPVTPGSPVYTVGSPLFERAEVRLGNDRTFSVVAHGASRDNKYIQSALLDGKPLEKPFFTHEELMRGGVLELKMGPYPNYDWGR